MVKKYIKEYNKVKLCTSNIAKMNILESMYYHRYRVIKNIHDTINDIYENLYIFINIFIILILPIVYPIMAYWEIKKAKKEMRDLKYSN